MLFGKYISKYYLKYGWILLFGIAALIVVDILQLEIPNMIGAVVNGMNAKPVVMHGKTFDFGLDFLLYNICLPFIVIVLVMFAGRFLWRICFIGTAFKVERDLRGKMFDKAKDLPQEFYSVNKVGSLMSLFTNDLETIQDCFGWGVMMLFDTLFLGTLAIIRMAQVSSVLTLFSLLPMLFLLAAALVLGSFMEKKWDQRQAVFSEISDFAQESFSGIAVIKSFVKEGKELLRFKKLNDKNEKANVDFTRLSTLFELFIALFIESVICIILGLGGYFVHEGAFSVGDLIAFVGYFDAIIWPILAISELIGMTSRGRASLKRVSALLDEKNTVCDSDTAVPLESVKGNIEFRHLNFTYPGSERQVLSDVSFTINAGENVGITGRTGSGKSTLVDLILRIYNVERGSLFIDGHDVNDVTIKSLRSFCACALQDNFLFGDTVKNNIAFALDEPDDETVIKRAKQAGVHDDIMGFKDGYDTILGERGITVSGGQKQRIAIARALCKDAPILILDDSVSAVDTATERGIIDSLKTERKGKTTILIAHRISSVENMDKIIYVSDGKIADVGTHAELYARCEEYKNSVDLQKLEAEKEEIENA